MTNNNFRTQYFFFTEQLCVTFFPTVSITEAHFLDFPKFDNYDF